MIVSRQWLLEYVQPRVPDADWISRLTMAGLNHDGTVSVGDDQAIHLEVTSNRPDCLGHLGVAREIAALLDLPLNVPDPQPPVASNEISAAVQIRIEAPHLCRRFTARLIRGVRVGKSPAWLVDRLATVGIASVNNIVDISNYVMLECGQPLHAFDFARLQGGTIIVREPRPGETLLAIDHKTYRLEKGMCVIADANRAVGLGGIMGGADTEVSDATTDVLVEAAHFEPRVIRQTARLLNLHSAASFRFERPLDGHRTDWASRRCCQLILELAGGQLARGVIDVGTSPVASEPIRLRHAQTNRILGIFVPPRQSASILQSLGFEVTDDHDDQLQAVPPSWRGDVTREADLIEEIGRIFGYEKVPDNHAVRMVASHRTPKERVIERVRRCLSAAGIDEAMTASVVPEIWSNSFSPWTQSDPLMTQQPILGVLEKSSQNIGPVQFLRRSLVPSLLEAYRVNEFRGNDDVHLFELAHVYLSRPKGLPDEPTKLAIVSQSDFYRIKGVLSSLVQLLNPRQQLSVVDDAHPMLDANWSVQLRIDGRLWGFLGMVSAQGKRTFGFRQTVCVAEVDLTTLLESAVQTAQFHEVSPYPAIHRDFNFVVDDKIRWHDIESTVRASGGEWLESVTFKELFRDEKKDGKSKKRLLLSVVLRSPQQTLTGDQADAVCARIVEQCTSAHGAHLVT